MVMIQHIVGQYSKTTFFNMYTSVAKNISVSIHINSEYWKRFQYLFTSVSILSTPILSTLLTYSLPLLSKSKLTHTQLQCPHSPASCHSSRYLSHSLGCIQAFVAQFFFTCTSLHFEHVHYCKNIVFMNVKNL